MSSRVHQDALVADASGPFRLRAIPLGGPLLRGFLFGVAPTDPRALATIALVLICSALAAVIPSALRARRTDPVSMLAGD